MHDIAINPLFNYGGKCKENPSFDNLPAAIKERVAHATIKIGEWDLMFSDTFPGSPYQKGNQVTLCITTKDVAKAKEIYAALQQGGQSIYPLEETPFCPVFGNLKDKFGVTFTIIAKAQ